MITFMNSNNKTYQLVVVFVGIFVIIELFNYTYVYEIINTFTVLFQCLQFKTEVQQDVRKMDKFVSNLIRHMASNDN